jgi:hypothetical protein
MDIGFIACLYMRKVIRIVIHHILDQRSYGIGVVDDGLMRNPDSMNISHDIGYLTARHAVIDVIGHDQAQSMHINMDPGQINRSGALLTIRTDLIHVEFEFTVVVMITVLLR